MSDKKTLSVSEAARLLKVSKSAIYRRIQSNKLTASKRGGGDYEIKLEDLIRSIQKQRESQVRENPVDATNNLEKSSGARPVNGIHTNQDHTLTRRDFLKGSLSFVLGFFSATLADALGSTASTVAYDRFANEVKLKRETQEIEQKHEELIERIFGRLYDSSWSANLAHFIDYYGEEHLWRSNTLRASVALGSVLGLQENNWLERAVFTDDYPGPVEIDGDIIAMGSPISDPIARMNMEYLAKSRYEQFRTADPLIELPMTYDVGFNLDVQGSTPVRRFVAGKERDKPNTTIRLDNELLPPPKLNRDGWLLSDYLLVTRMPNILNRNAFINGAEVLIVGGAHGVGTEAIELLTKDVNLLDRVSKQIGDAPYYQILVPVVEVEHGVVNEIQHSFPMKLANPVVRKIHVDVEKILSRWADDSDSKPTE